MRRTFGGGHDITRKFVFSTSYLLKKVRLLKPVKGNVNW